MKKILMLSVIVMGAMLFSGCAGIQKIVVAVPKKVDTKTNMEYSIYKNPEGDYSVQPKIGGEYQDIKSGQEKSLENAQSKRKVFYALFRAAARGTKDMGYNYFIVTNPEISGFGGFPIHNFNQLMKYVTLADRKPSFDTVTGMTSATYMDLINSAGDVSLRFVPVPKKVYDSGVYAVWKVSDFIR